MSNEMLIMPTRTRRIDGLTIRYTEIDAADGPVILLTSPWPESLLAYRRVWPALATRARLVAIDLPGFGHSQGRTDLFRPDAMAEFLHRLIGEFELGSPHLVAPDVGTSAALFLAARHPGAVKSLIVGSGASAWPLETGGVLADIIAAPDIEAFKSMDVRATVGATVEPVASHEDEPLVWEDYVTSYEYGRFAESTRYVRSYPTQLALLRDLLPMVKVPVHIVECLRDPLVPPSNGRYLAERLPSSRLTILDTGHFPWELDPGQYGTIIAEWVARAETVRLRIPPPFADGNPRTSSASAGRGEGRRPEENSSYDAVHARHGTDSVHRGRWHPVRLPPLRRA
jgi:pimeloyl-ACP methyl ester carboxylesterase